MLRIIFETHATSLDNEAGLASGHHDVALSETGEAQARDLGKRYQHVELDALFCSDLQRSYRTAELAFEGKAVVIVQDPRLRECDYGRLSRQPTVEIEAVRSQYIGQPFPGGESYQQAASRVQEALQDLRRYDDGACVMIIGHRATQYGLEHWLNGVPLEEAVEAPWEWQPGWEYTLEAGDRL